MAQITTNIDQSQRLSFLNNDTINNAADGQHVTWSFLALNELVRKVILPPGYHINVSLDWQGLDVSVYSESNTVDTTWWYKNSGDPFEVLVTLLEWLLITKGYKIQ
jgi:hypothetical protein